MKCGIRYCNFLSLERRGRGTILHCDRYIRRRTRVGVGIERMEWCSIRVAGFIYIYVITFVTICGLLSLFVHFIVAIKQCRINQ